MTYFTDDYTSAYHSRLEKCDLDRHSGCQVLITCTSVNTQDTEITDKVIARERLSRLFIQFIRCQIDENKTESCVLGATERD